MSSTENTTAKTTPTTPLTPPSTPRKQKTERKARTPDETEKKLYSPKTQHALPSPPASPPQVRSESPDKDKSLSENTRRPSVSELRTKFGLDDWRCGAVRNNEVDDCGRRIQYYPKNIRYSEVAIDTQIENVIKYSISSSPRLLWETLYKLAQMVHCNSHNHDERRFRRAKNWRTVIDLKESVEEQILKVLQNYDPACTAKNEDRTPCGSRTMGWRVHNRSKTIDIILKPETYLDNKRLGYFLQVLKACMLCEDHNDCRGYKKIKKWKKEIQTILKENSGEEGSTALDVSKLPAENSENPENPADYWEDGFDNSLFDIIADNTFENQISSFGEIRNVLNKVQNSNWGEGYVYAFTNEANPGYVKIGYTTLSLEGRLQKWEKDCSRKFMALYPLSPIPAKVPNASRVEELCHAELKHRNIRTYCRCCLRPHVEWFKVSPEEAIAVIGKWSKWMRTEPYTKSFPGKLKQNEFRKVQNMGNFMKNLSASYISEN